MNTNIALKGLSALAVGMVGFSLTACPGNPAGNGISGQVTAPTGQVVNGVSVGACFQGTCNSSNSKEVVVNGTQSANYQITGLVAGQYVVLAVKDANNSGRLDAGDWFGAFGPLNNPTPVTSPASNINVTMGVVTSVQGTAQALGMTPQRLESSLEALIRQDTP